MAAPPAEDGAGRRSGVWKGCDTPLPRPLHSTGHETDFADPDLLTEQYRWLLERGEALHRILAPRVGKLPWPE